MVYSNNKLYSFNTLQFYDVYQEKDTHKKSFQLWERFFEIVEVST